VRETEGLTLFLAAGAIQVAVGLGIVESAHMDVLNSGLGEQCAQSGFREVAPARKRELADVDQPLNARGSQGLDEGFGRPMPPVTDREEARPAV
jgi:hypothetical protein